jgi:hypothetical protein
MNDEHSTRNELEESNGPELSRRRLIVLGAAGLSALALGGCKKGAPSSCSDVSGLTPDEQNVRTMLAYTDRSPEAGNTCAVCQHYVAPASVDQCGSCKILKGPVHPDGYCKSFVKKA